MTSLTLLYLVHDGETKIGDTLGALRDQDLVDCKLIVVINGGQDNSGSVVRNELGHLEVASEVVMLPAAGRVSALNAVRPRFHGHLLVLDQDITMSPGAVGEIRAALDTGSDFVTLVPIPRHSPSGIARRCMRAWTRLPYVRLSPSSAGLFALSSSALDRVPTIPAVLSDDKFLRLTVPLERRKRIERHSYWFDPPSDLRQLVSQRRRYDAGNRELGTQYELERDAPRFTLAGLVGLLRHPLDSIALVLVGLLARLAR